MDEGTQVLQAMAGANGRGGINPSFLALRIYNIVYYLARAREYIIYNAKKGLQSAPVCAILLVYQEGERPNKQNLYRRNSTKYIIRKAKKYLINRSQCGIINTEIREGKPTKPEGKLNYG